MKRKPVDSAARWRVYRIAGKAACHLTELKAASADEAIRRTIKEFGISDPEQQRRLGAQRVD